MTQDELKQKILGLRLEFGDTDDYYMIFQDSEYEYFIKKYGNNDKRLSTQLTFGILNKLALTSVRERIGQEERFGNMAFDNYMKVLQSKLKDPAFGNIAPLSYYGGVYRDIAEYYDTDPSYTWQPYYQGSTTGYPTWKGLRIFGVNGNKIEPYENLNFYQ